MAMPAAATVESARSLASTRTNRDRSVAKNNCKHEAARRERDDHQFNVSRFAAADEARLRRPGRRPREFERPSDQYGREQAQVPDSVRASSAIGTNRA
jgi:hypothetical protein